MKAKLLKKFRRSAKTAIYAEAVHIENKFTGERETYYDVWRSPDHSDILQAATGEYLRWCCLVHATEDEAATFIDRVRREYINGLVRLVRSGEYSLDWVLKFL